MTGKSITLILLLFAASTANADLILGVRAGAMDVSFENVDTDKQPVNAGISIGYELDSLLSGLAVEAELTRSVAAGEVATNDLEVDSQGIYLSYSTAGDLYLRGRIGVMDASLSAGELTEDEGGETYGVAIGKRFNNFLLELDYTSIDDDVSYASLAFKYQFKFGL